MKILLTGANGFIGRHLVPLLQSQGHQLVLPVRHPGLKIAGTATQYLNDFSDDNQWAILLQGVDVMIHLAGRAHVMKEDRGDPATLFQQANVDFPLRLAKIAVSCQVKRLVFVSSIGVMGPARTTPFSCQDQPAPVELYARSKWQAEQALTALSQQYGLELVIVRPPLVYGPNAPGNFGRLLRLAKLPLPLPLGAVHNQRSFVSVQNLADFLGRCAVHLNAAGQTFLVCDGQDISTTQLLLTVRRLLGRPAWLLPVPVRWLRWCCQYLGATAIQQKLLDSLQIEQRHTTELLQWQPPLTVMEGLAQAVSSEASVPVAEDRH
ncbi:NAD-dependent epimerase/dehydratase family protein [Rheinheimera sp.]|uniref:NAD-dependent epimerase/dehydratase family protein n=1 Tax=Rheinheimera sp. TaxID=1869214 RepID=UPI003D2B6975